MPLDASQLLKSGSIVLRHATIADAAALSRFAARTFQEAFGSENKAIDMEAYMLEAFSPAVQSAEIADRAASVILAVRRGVSGEALIGYAHLVADEAGASIQLKRLYVDARWRGRGLSPLLMDEVLCECRRRGAERLWLAVWERNDRAIVFYKKIGFHISGQQTFRLGEDVQIDHVMEMVLPDDGR